MATWKSNVKEMNLSSELNEKLKDLINPLIPSADCESGNSNGIGTLVLSNFKLSPLLLQVKGIFLSVT